MFIASLCSAFVIKEASDPEKPHPITTKDKVVRYSRVKVAF